MLAEAVIVLPLALAILAGAGMVMKTEWDRTYCAWKTFEAVHARRIGKSFSKEQLAARVSIEESSTEVSGTGRCGRAVEKVSLPLLEPES